MDGKYPTVLERITDPDGNVGLYKTSLSSVLLTRAGGNIQTCKRYADALEDSARIAGEETLYALRDIFDIGGGYHYIHLYLDIWRVHLNEAAPDVRAQQEAAIRTYAEEHPDDSKEVLQMLEHLKVKEVLRTIQNYTSCFLINTKKHLKLKNSIVIPKLMNILFTLFPKPNHSLISTVTKTINDSTI